MDSDGDNNTKIIIQDYEYEEEEEDETMEHVASPGGSNTMRGKYYKQTYRPAWEKMSDFKGWLRGVEGQPTRAFCMYCQKTLHAHRLSLLKHTCTVRHQKATALHNARKNKVLRIESVQRVDTGAAALLEDKLGEDNDNLITVVEYQSGNEEELEQEEIEATEEESQDAKVQQQHTIKPVPMKNIIRQPISTQVIDSHSGSPVGSLQISLYKLIEGRWTYLNEGLTNSDGRFANFLEKSDFTPGRYKLHYDVDRYFESKRVDSPLPFIESIFDCRTSGEQYNIALYLSPYGYNVFFNA